MILPLAAISAALFGLFAWEERKRRARKKKAASTYDVYPPQARSYAPVPQDTYSAAGTETCGAISIGHDWWEGPARNVFEGAYREGISDTDELTEIVIERVLSPCYQFLDRPTPALKGVTYDLGNAIEAWKAERQTGLALPEAEA
ncbi:hypothetical protein LCGC14_2543190 [marine sediment metagenome]|uniref:Uncharacterized protein n=1 Tax=marine sediment metagenome TaxID=412755 RepID=A0A0F9AQL0_9ZZZZ